MRARSRTSLLCAALLALFALPARALTIADVRPAYFDAVTGFGFESTDAFGRPLVPSLSATPSDQWISAPSEAVSIAQQISAVYGDTVSPTPQSPAIVDSLWTVTNVGAGSLVAPLLVFTALDPQGTQSPTPMQGLDVDLLEILSYSVDGTDYLFGAARLPDLENGQSAQLTVRYVVASPLSTSDAGKSLAPLGVSMLGTYASVPEPSTSCLLALGVALCCAASAAVPETRAKETSGVHGRLRAST